MQINVLCIEGLEQRQPDARFDGRIEALSISFRNCRRVMLESPFFHVNEAQSTCWKKARPRKFVILISQAGSVLLNSNGFQ